MHRIVEAVLRANNPITAAVIAIAALACALPARAQSLLERTPNLTGGWTGPPGVVHFNFLHRFSVGPAPQRQVTNSPTFLLAWTPAQRALLGVNYATRSALSPGYPNEWEVFGRYAVLSFATVQAGYNNAAQSFDGEVDVHYDLGRVRLLAAARLLSDASDVAVAGGAVVRLSRYIALAGDVFMLEDSDPGWGAALQLAIPYSPHTFSLQATNTNTATLQGASRITTRTRYGFEFTVPLTPSRWFGRRNAAGEETIPESAVVVSMQSLRFEPRDVSVARGTTIVWRNDDQLAHTVTALDGSWTSPLIQPGGTWRRTFDTAGSHQITCTPHPFMRATVEVAQ